MRKFKLLAVLIATMFATTNLWAAFPIGDGTGLEYTWTYPDASSMTLVITYDGVGTGVMPDYDNSTNKAPWNGSTLNPKYIEIQLPNGLKNIGNYAFYNYTNEALTELTIPSSVTSIGIQAVNIPNLERLVMQSAVAPSLGANAIPAHAVDFTIVYPCGSGESYVNNWTAFYSYLTPAEPCSEPKPAFNPSGDCGTNAHYAFNGSTGVLTISGTGAMQDYTAGTQPWYSYKNQVTSIVVEDGITAIGNLAFSGCSASVSLPATSLTSIGTSAFSSNTILESITIPASVETIGNNAFQSCSALETVTFVSPNSALTSIGQYAFQYTALTSVTIPATTNGLTIGSYAFRNLTTLTSLTFAAPSNVIMIGSYAFGGTGLTSVEIPATQKNMTIDANAFNGCSSLATVTFATPSKVTTIEMTAFQGTAISSITLPASLTYLGGRAFRNCTNLAEVIFTSADCPRIFSNSFQGCNESLVLKCPDESGLLYSNKIFPVSEDYWDILYMYPSGERAPAPAAGGFCGKDGSEDMMWDIVWNDKAKSIMLDITGEGPMEEWDFMADSWAPWKNFRSWIKYIRIAEGVTTIGGSAFVGCDQVKTFIIPSTVTSIGADAFYGCDNDDVEVYSYANPATLLTWDDRNCDDFLTHGRGPRARTYTWDERTAHLQETKCYVPSAYLAGYRTKWNAGSTEWTGTDVNVFFAVGLNDANDAAGINEILTNTDGERVPVLTLTRPLNRDGYFATICLPIDMDAAAIAKSALKDAQIREFTNATMNGGMLEVEFSPVDHIEAGKPYFVKYTDAAMGDALDRLDFVDAVVNNVAPEPVTHGKLQMIGTYVPKSVSVQTSATDGEGVLFLGANNTLYWPSKAGTIKPFRAYFKLVGGGGAGSPKRGTPARIVERQNAPTGVDNATNNAQYTKRVENGQLVIERNGVRYNAAGQVVK